VHSTANIDLIGAQMAPVGMAHHAQGGSIVPPTDVTTDPGW
jgi:hypothetical protein